MSCNSTQNIYTTLLQGNKGYFRLFAPQLAALIVPTVANVFRQKFRENGANSFYFCFDIYDLMLNKNTECNKIILKMD